LVDWESSQLGHAPVFIAGRVFIKWMLLPLIAQRPFMMRVNSHVPPKLPVVLGEPDEAATPDPAGSAPQDSSSSARASVEPKDVSQVGAATTRDPLPDGTCRNPDWVPDVVPSLIDNGKHGAEYYARFGGGVELDVKNCEIDSIRVEAGAGYKLGLGKHGYTLEPSIGGAHTEKFELMDPVGSDPPVAGETRLGFTFGVSFGLPALSLDLVGVNFGVSHKADGTVGLYGNASGPTVVMQPASLFSLEGWKAEAGAKGGAEFSYKFK
jgi:hypothetical protein